MCMGIAAIEIQKNHECEVKPRCHIWKFRRPSASGSRRRRLGKGLIDPSLSFGKPWDRPESIEFDALVQESPMDAADEFKRDTCKTGKTGKKRNCRRREHSPTVISAKK